MKHYFTDNNDLSSNPQQFSYRFHNQNFVFITDNGVFSKKYIDYGTHVLLNSLNIAEGKKVLDVGCGYGVIGICLAKIFNHEVTMIDVNQRAVDLTKKNAQNNNVKVEAFISDGYENIVDKYDVILTNPPIRAGKQIVLRIVTEAYDHLFTNGELYVVIQKKQGAPSIEKAILEKFDNCQKITKDKGYYVLKAIKNV